MKTKKILSLAAFLLLSPLLLTACKAGLKDARLYGTWVRGATYVNDVLEHETPATLVIDRDSFSSQNQLCTTSGSAVATDDSQIEVTMTESDCPAPMQLPFVLTYNYEISEDSQLLNLAVQGVREEYHRQ